MILVDIELSDGPYAGGKVWRSMPGFNATNKDGNWCFSKVIQVPAVTLSGGLSGYEVYIIKVDRENIWRHMEGLPVIAHYSYKDDMPW